MGRAANDFVCGLMSGCGPVMMSDAFASLPALRINANLSSFQKISAFRGDALKQAFYALPVRWL